MSVKYCIDCGKQISNKADRCKSCGAIKRNKERRKMELRDKDWLFKKYWVEELSSVEIAKMLDVSKPTVLNALERELVEKRTHIETKRLKAKRQYNGYLYDKGWLEEKYEREDLSSLEIASILGCTHTSVLKALKRVGISVRDPYDAHSGRHAACRHRIIPKHHTKPELIFEEICKKCDLQYKYTGDGAFWIGKSPSVNPDFVECNGKKIAVEIFSYWHDPIRRFGKVRYSHTYEGRKAILKQYGWKLVVFWQEDLEREDAEAFVLSTLNRGGAI